MGIDHSDPVGWPAQGTAAAVPVKKKRVLSQQQKAARATNRVRRKKAERRD